MAEELKKLEDGWLEKNKNVIWNTVYAPYTPNQLKQIEDMKNNDKEIKKMV